MSWNQFIEFHLFEGTMLSSKEMAYLTVKVESNFTR